jgi:putative SOS response-associated peptidase YedK
MCGRTSLAVPQSTLEARFEASASSPLEPRYNVAPGDDLAVVTAERPERIDLLTWGLVPEWVDDPDAFGAPINARAETVGEKPTFRDAYRSRPCLVLADGFYEWRRTRGGSQPYRVTLADDEPFALAGLWERHPDAGATVTVLTTDANGLVGEIHDRMPVVLAPEEETTWLTAAPDARRDLLDPYPADGMRSFPVSTAVNDPRNDRPAVARPADVPRQSGLGDFAG